MVAPSVDLLGLLRPSQVTVTVAGQPFALEAKTAADWLGAIATDPDGLYGIIPGLIADDDLDLMRQLMDSHPDIEQRWFYAARSALGKAAGRDWWWSWNLCRKILSGWIYFNGIMLRQGMDARAVLLPDWLDACYTMLWQGADEENRTKLDMELALRPRGVAIAGSHAARRQMEADFAAD